MIHIKKIFFALLLVIWVLLISNINLNAATLPVCKTYPFLKPTFNMANFLECKSFLEKCPHEGPLPAMNCVAQVIKSKRICRQSGQLAAQLKATIPTLSVTRKNNFLIIDQLFPADGQHQYYILSNKGNCLLDTNIDPRILDETLQKKFNKISLFYRNANMPIEQSLPDNRVSFTVRLKLTENCLACEVLGYANIRYIFDPAGKLVKAEAKTELESNKF